MKFLIIEDDEVIGETVSLALKMRWSQATIITTKLGEKGVDLVDSEDPDLVLLDLGLPDINGFDVLRKIRCFSKVPVIIVTARGDETDVVKGLEWGANDYIVKPFRQMELLARIQAQIRKTSDEGHEEIVYGSLHLYVNDCILYRNKRKINLTLTECRILSQLMLQRGNVIVHSKLCEVIWGEEFIGAEESLRVHIRRLRAKLEEDPTNPKVILIKSRVGYYLSLPD